MLGASGAVWAHPLTEPGTLPFSPLTAAALGAIIIVLAATLTKAAGRSELGDDVTARDDTLRRPQYVTRAVALVLLGLAIAAGRLGSPLELENIAPALVVGTAWPLLIILCALIGRVWPWLDPFDSLARLLGGTAADVGPTDQSRTRGPGVLWAAPVALAWTWYLSVYSGSLSPPVVGGVLALYTIVIVAGCLAFGRTTVLSRVELFGIFYELVGHVRSRKRKSWIPPRFAELVLAVLVGGLLFGGLRQSILWGELNASPQATLLATMGLLVSCVVSLLLVCGVSRLEQSDTPAVTMALVPLTAAVAVAVAMARNRLTTSLQLLPGLVTDPFGRVTQEAALLTVDPSPFGTTGRAVIQMVVIITGAVLGAIVARRRFGTRANPAVGVVCLLTAVAVVAVAAV